MLLGDDEFDHEEVADVVARRGLDAADRMRGCADGEGDYDFGLVGAEVGFPPALDFAVADVARGLVQKAFGLIVRGWGDGGAAEFVGVFGARGRDDEGVFGDAPG